jgi:hypothetical protein
MRFLLPMNAHKVAAGIIALGMMLGNAPAGHAGWLQLLEGLAKGGEHAGAVAKEDSTVAREADPTGKVVSTLPRPSPALQNEPGEELPGDMLLKILGSAAVGAAISVAMFYGGLWLARRRSW